MQNLWSWYLYTNMFPQKLATDYNPGNGLAHVDTIECPNVP